MPYLPETLRKQVFDRADHRCEYCRTSRRVIGMPLVVDHIVPRVQGGEDSLENLYASCYRCNEYKGAKMHAFDPVSGHLVSLYNPRAQEWKDHFAWANGGTHIIGLTPGGRATVIALRLNNEYVVESRVLWMSRDWHPPRD